MTYCVGLLLNEGMVLLSDTRTNAGLDNISTYRKMFTFEDPGERVIVIMTAGSLSVTQTTIAQLREAIEDPEASPDTSIMLAPTLLKVAEIVGAALAKVRAAVDEKLSAMQGASASMIVAGQRKDGTMRLFLIYPEGNFIEATEDTPFLQIGEHKYGKPILDRAVKFATAIPDGVKLALISMDSTLRSNLTVGLPIDLMVFRRDARQAEINLRIGEDDPYFRMIRERWSAALRDAHRAIARPDWMPEVPRG